MRRTSDPQFIHTPSARHTATVQLGQPGQAIQQQGGGVSGEPVYPCTIEDGIWGSWEGPVATIGTPRQITEFSPIVVDVFGNVYYSVLIDSGGLVAEFYRWGIDDGVVSKIGEYSHTDPYDTADIYAISCNPQGDFIAWGEEFQTSGNFNSRAWVWESKNGVGYGLPHPNPVDEYFAGGAALSSDGSLLATVALWVENTNGFNYIVISINGGTWAQIPQTVASNGSNAPYVGIDENNRIHVVMTYESRSAYSYIYSDNQGANWSQPVYAQFTDAGARRGDRLIVSPKGSLLFTAQQLGFESCFTGTADGGINWIPINSTMRWPNNLNAQFPVILNSDPYGCTFNAHLRTYDAYNTDLPTYAAIIENGPGTTLLGTDIPLVEFPDRNVSTNVYPRLCRRADGSLVFAEYHSLTLRRRIKEDRFV